MTAMTLERCSVSVGLIPVVRHVPSERPSAGAAARPSLQVVPAMLPVQAEPVAPAGEMRLTRRGRAVVFALGFGAALLLGLGLAANSLASQDSAQVDSVTVSTGDTLWGIASGVAGDGATVDMVEEIKELNGLAGGALQAGQVLQVPVAR